MSKLNINSLKVTTYLWTLYLQLKHASKYVHVHTHTHTRTTYTPIKYWISPVKSQARKFPYGQQVQDPVSPQLWHRFDSWPEKLPHAAEAAKKKKKKKVRLDLEIKDLCFLEN